MMWSGPCSERKEERMEWDPTTHIIYFYISEFMVYYLITYNFQNYILYLLDQNYFPKDKFLQRRKYKRNDDGIGIYWLFASLSLSFIINSNPKNEEYCIFIILSSHNILLPLYLGPILTLHSLLTLFAPIDCKDGFVENIIMKNCRFKL